jgi:AFG3 family protein
VPSSKGPVKPPFEQLATDDGATPKQESAEPAATASPSSPPAQTVTAPSSAHDANTTASVTGEIPHSATAAATPTPPAEDTNKPSDNKDEPHHGLPPAKATPVPPPEGADKPPPRGFEHYYNKNFSRQADTDPKTAFHGVPLEEEMVNATYRNQVKRNRRGLMLGVGAVVGVLYFGFFGNTEKWRERLRHSSWFVPHGSIASFEHYASMADRARFQQQHTGGASADGDAAEGETEGETAAAAYAAVRNATRRVYINLDHHVARLFDDDGHLIGIATFVDIGSLKERLAAWRSTVTRHIAEVLPATGGADAAAATTTTPNERTITTELPPEIYYAVPAFFPFAAICFLWLLPFLATVHRTLNMQVRAAGAARPAGPAKPSRFKLEIDVKTKLNDVAGLTEVKMEVLEIVHMLKHPAAYTKLGARVPHGVLIDGPPGVGKTLLAKAVAGEAGLPFISCSGSEFDEVYVGVGAKRVRELFQTAKKNKPCVIFIDEIDTFGRKRRNDRSGSSRATINALLNELDGFTESNDIMVLAATNRADTLDEALTRSGRFDRKISVDMPPHKDRVEIAKVHLKPLNLNPALVFDAIAETLGTMTPGCSGADIYNICNEAAITASRLGKDHVDLECFYKAMDRIMIGLEKKAKRLLPDERERLAYHEAGHVVLSWFQETADPVLKSTITPRGGRTTGVTKKLPVDRYISTQQMLREKMVHQLGGYVAEEFFFEDVSSSAADDLRTVTDLARQEVTTYGMAPKEVGHFGYHMDENAIQKPYGERKADVIDSTVNNIASEVLTAARKLLTDHLEQVRIVAGLLIKNETVTARELWIVLGERPVMTKEFREYLETAAS